jgi:tryptophan synthase alpha chain
VSLADGFRRAREAGRAALVPYLTAGYPDTPRFLDAVERIAEHADLIEVGVPFSDPLGDGPTIQAAGEAALRAGVTPTRALELAGEVAVRTGRPVAVMTYANPVLTHAGGPAGFCREAAARGVSGLILPDVPADEDDEIFEAARGEGLETVFLVAPTSTAERLSIVTARCSGFVYAVSLTGVTGARDRLPEEAFELVGRIREHTGLPVAIGFGVSSRETAAAAAAVADGVVVGSAFIQRLTAGSDVAAFAAELAEGCRQGKMTATRGAR